MRIHHSMFFCVAFCALLMFCALGSWRSNERAQRWADGILAWVFKWWIRVLEKYG